MFNFGENAFPWLANIKGEEMSIKKRPDGKWLVDARPDGRNGKRVRRVCVTRREAEEFERQLMEHTKVSHQFAVKLDRRHLSELCEIWWNFVEHERNNIEKRNIEKTIRQMNNPMVYLINDEFMIEFMSSRLKTKIRKASLARDIYRLSGMFTKLISKGECEINPLNNTWILLKRVQSLYDSDCENGFRGIFILPPDYYDKK